MSVRGHRFFEDFATGELTPSASEIKNGMTNMVGYSASLNVRPSESAGELTFEGARYEQVAQELQGLAHALSNLWPEG